ncbi:hypothetical protein NFI96_023716, partial [Prochilodus magdalenae]
MDIASMILECDCPVDTAAGLPASVDSVAEPPAYSALCAAPGSAPLFPNWLANLPTCESPVLPVDPKSSVLPVSVCPDLMFAVAKSASMHTPAVAQHVDVVAAAVQGISAAPPAVQAAQLPDVSVPAQPPSQLPQFQSPFRFSVWPFSCSMFSLMFNPSPVPGFVVPVTIYVSVPVSSVLSVPIPGFTYVAPSVLENIKDKFSLEPKILLPRKFPGSLRTPV